MTTQRTAKLRVCASCEWIYKCDEKITECPECGFASYGARYVYGDKAYKYLRTQQPWLDKQIANFRSSLYSTLRNREEIIHKQKIFKFR